MVHIIYSNDVRNLVLLDDGNTLPIMLLDVIKLMIQEMNNDLYIVGVL